MTDMLQEFCDSRGVAVRVDREAGVIRGVKLLGLRSRNGRAYLPDALTEAVGLYEDAKVNVNHPKGSATGPRDYQDRIGTVRLVAFRPGEGLFGDFHFNPKHALAEQLIWDAEHAPENVGFSHNVEARVAQRDGRVVVEAITRVQSVDLVADPATTHGLFEAASSPELIEGDSSVSAAQKLEQPPLTLDDLTREHPELVESIRGEQAEEIERLREELERLTALEAQRQKRALVRRLLREYGLPDIDSARTDAEGDNPVLVERKIGDTEIGTVPQELANAMVSRRFVETLLATADEQAMRALVEERSQLINALAARQVVCAVNMRPQSRDQQPASGIPPVDARSFVRAIT